MTINKNIVTYTLLLLTSAVAAAQGPLTLDECRRRATADNKGMRQAAEKKAETEAMEKVALWQMLPKVSANGAFVYTDKSIQLLSEEQKEEINTMGTRVQQDLNASIEGRLSGSGIIGQAIGGAIEDALMNSGLENSINSVGHQITDALNFDVHSVTGGAVTLTQPLFMGGKLMAAYRAAKLMDELSGIEYNKKKTETLIAVDEAYWQVVSVQHKAALAEQYAELLRTLNGNVEQMVEAEVATMGDLTKVRVKLNEAEMSLTKAQNGLVLARMLLAQRCGMPLDTLFTVDTAISEVAPLESVLATGSIDTILTRRNEMRMLTIADSLALQSVVIARSTLLPNVALSGGYLLSNPNLFDGVKKEWGGTWMAGVVVNVPLFHPGGFYALKAAKAKRRQVMYQRQEAEEMIELQVKKVSSELELAYKKLAQAESNMDNAQENLKLADESFKAGMCGSSDLMAAQTAWMQAQGEVIDARIEIAMGKVYLRQATGEDR